MESRCFGHDGDAEGGFVEFNTTKRTTDGLEFQILSTRNCGIGASNEGYWNMEQLLQCLQILYPQLEFVFLFDHSQGHAHKRNGALTALNMSRGYGGAQAKMRDTVILEEEGYLGPHSPIVKASDTQSLVYLESDSGPWFLSPVQQQLQRHDRPTGRCKHVDKRSKEGSCGVSVCSRSDPPTTTRINKKGTPRICKEQWH